MRVECPEHGVLAGRAPWARCAESRMTSSFEDRRAWGAAQMGEKAASGLWRVSRRTVGSARGRVYEELLARSGGSPPRGLGRIGVTTPTHKNGTSLHFIQGAIFIT